MTPIIIDRKDQLSKRAGEILLSSTTSATANAFFDATGVRIRERR